MKKPIISKILKSLEKEAGVKIILEPNYEYAGQILLSDGRKRYFRDTHLDINTIGASTIAKDKDYAAFFMKKLGFPVVESFKFYSKNWCDKIGSNVGIDKAYSRAKKIGFPLIVKPNDTSQGEGVCKVYNREEFYRASRFIFKNHNVALLQPVIAGRDYRIVVLDNEVISAYERIPLFIIGDGKSTIFKLITKQQKEFIKRGRETQIDMNDYRILMNLKRRKLTLNSVLNKKVRLYLLDNANLSTGGFAKDVTKNISDAFKKIAIKLAREMNLRFAGVDLITTDDITNDIAKNYVILEINSAPGLDHYAYIGKRQCDIVRKMYLKVLKAMSK